MNNDEPDVHPDPPSKGGLALYFLRWILVLPAAIAGMVAAYYVMKSAMFWASPIDPAQMSLIEVLFSSCFTHIVTGVGYVFAGSLTAPRYRLQTSLVLCGILLFAAGGLFFSESIRQEGWWAYISGALTIAGAVGTAIYIYLTPEKFK